MPGYGLGARSAGGNTLPLNNRAIRCRVLDYIYEFE